MDWLVLLLFGAWYGEDGRSKAAEVGGKYLVPLLALIAVGLLGALLLYTAF
jgi:hypothetical protein